MNDEEQLCADRIESVRDEWTIDCTDAEDDGMPPAIAFRHGALVMYIVPTVGEGIMHVDVVSFSYGERIGATALTVLTVLN